MARRRARLTSLSVAAICGWALCAASLVAQAPATTPLPNAPEGFDVRKPDIKAGRVERVEYDSKVTGNKRPAMVYLPPDYSSGKKYPVLYLLHGIGGNENHWTQFGKADSILDNLIAANKAVPMIVVMPNGRASNEPSTAFGGRGGPGGGGRGPAAPGAPPQGGQGQPAAAPPAGAAPQGAGQAGATPAAGAGGRGGRPGGAGMNVEFIAYAAFEKELIGDLDSFHRVALFGAGRSRASCARRTVDGRRTVAELRPRQSQHVRMGWRLLLGAQHVAAGAAGARRGGGEETAEAAVGVVRRQGFAVQHQRRRAQVSRRAEGASRLAHRRWRRARLPCLEERPVSPLDAAVPVGPLGQILKPHGFTTSPTPAVMHAAHNGYLR